MGQKTNVSTIRKSQLQYLATESKDKRIIFLYIILNYLNTLFIKFDVCLINSIVQNNSYKCFVNLVLFFRTRKILKIKKKYTKLKKKKVSFLKFLFNFFSLNIFSNLFVISFKVLNKNLIKKKPLNKLLLTEFFKMFKRYSKLLFPRRLNFFLDFIKISVLLFTDIIKINFFNKLLAETFSILQKKRHSFFLQFLKFIFTTLITYKLVGCKSRKKFSRIIGIKLILSGKIKGKPRSNSECLILGNIPIQTLSSNIQYVRNESHTVYGVFGFRLWLNRQNI
jgi:hypothetical protein